MYGFLTQEVSMVMKRKQVQDRSNRNENFY